MKKIDVLSIFILLLKNTSVVFLSILNTEIFVFRLSYSPN
jgi:hypothetical protein